MSSHGILESTSFPHRHLGSAGTLAAAWALAGGVAGGMLFALLVITGHMHPQGTMILGVALAFAGSLLGTIHGGVLGRISRQETDTPGETAGTLLTALAILAAFVFAIAFAIWLALTAIVARAGSTLGWIAHVAILAMSVGILTWATLLGWRALERAYHRWPDHRLGLALVLGAFALLLFLMLAVRPAIPGTDVQLSNAASVIVAALAALWLATPAVIIGLRFAHRRR